MLESVCVSVPASVGVVVPGTAVVDDPLATPVAVVPVTGVVAETPPARLIAAPHVAVALVFVTRTSVTIRVCPAGTVNAVTAVVPAGTMRVISTTLSTTGVPAVVTGDALGVDVTDVGASGDVVVVSGVGIVEVVWAES
jgi:hypothetical protein